MRRMANDEIDDYRPSETQRIIGYLTLIALVTLIIYLIAPAFAS